MTTIRDFRELLKPIVARRGDLHSFNRYVIFVSIRAGFKGLLLDRSSTREEFDARQIARPLCVMSEGCPMGWEMGMGRPGTQTYREAFPNYRFYKPEQLDKLVTHPWLTTDPDFPEGLRDAIENKMLAELKDISTLREFADWTNRNHAADSFDYAQCAVLVEPALGNFSEAARLLSVPHGKLLHREFDAWLPGLGDRLEAMGDDLPLADKRAIVAMLHAREAAVIKSLKLEKFWQPAPFPAEELGLV